MFVWLPHWRNENSRRAIAKIASHDARGEMTKAPSPLRSAGALHRAVVRAHASVQGFHTRRSRVWCEGSG
jgi:hypothetical protein